LPSACSIPPHRRQAQTGQPDLWTKPLTLLQVLGIGRGVSAWELAGAGFTIAAIVTLSLPKKP